MEDRYIKYMLELLDDLFRAIQNSIRDRNNEEKNEGISSLSSLIYNKHVYDTIYVYRWHYDTFSQLIKKMDEDNYKDIRKDSNGKHYIWYMNDDKE